VSLDDKLNAWAKGPGKAKVSEAAIKKVDLNGLTSSLVSCIQAVVPPALAPGFSASASVQKNNDGTASISLEFQNKTRSSFTGAVHDIYGLFSQGWSYDSARAPFGVWHGQRVRARASYVGQAFVESGVNAWKDSLGGGIDVQSVTINPLYT